MKAHLIDAHLPLLRSRSSAKVKVKYQCHVPQKMGVSGAFMFHKHILFVFFCSVVTTWDCMVKGQITTVMSTFIHSLYSSTILKNVISLVLKIFHIYKHLKVIQLLIGSTIPISLPNQNLSYFQIYN